MTNKAIIDANKLYFSARFDECIDVCDRLRTSSRFTGEQRSHVTLLMARSMLRLEKFYEAEDVLSEHKCDRTMLDARVTSEMLVAMARIRRGLPDDGLALLSQTNRNAMHVHRSIRSEIALYEAYAYFAKHDMPAVLRAIARVTGDSDVIHARALQVQGFCHTWNGQKRDAAASFLGALIRLDTCKHRDHVVAAAAIAGLSVIAYEMNDSSLMHIVEHRYPTMHWPAGTSRYRHQLEVDIALHADFLGDTAKAMTFALRALDTAGTNCALRAGSYAQLARFANHARDHGAAGAWLQLAHNLLSEMRDLDLHGRAEADWALLQVAREIALYDAVRSRRLLARYRSLTFNALSIHSDNPQTDAEFRLIEGLMHVGEDNTALARQCFREVHDAYRACGFVSEAAEAAHWLSVLGDDSMGWYVCGLLAGASNWMTRVHAVKLG